MSIPWITVLWISCQKSSIHLISIAPSSSPSLRSLLTRARRRGAFRRGSVRASDMGKMIHAGRPRPERNNCCLSQSWTNTLTPSLRWTDLESRMFVLILVLVIVSIIRPFNFPFPWWQQSGKMPAAVISLESTSPWLFISFCGIVVTVFHVKTGNYEPLWILSLVTLWIRVKSTLFLNNIPMCTSIRFHQPLHAWQRDALLVLAC